MIITVYGELELTYGISGDDMLSEHYDVSLNGQYVGIFDYHDIEDIMNQEGATFAHQLSEDTVASLLEEYDFV